MKEKFIRFFIGMDPKNVFTLETGQVLEITSKTAFSTERVHTGILYVDGLGVGDVGNIVLRDRRNLANDGMVIVVVAIDKNNFEIVSGPDVITRGFIYVRESEDLIREIKNLSKDKIDECLEKEIIEWQVLKSSVKKSVEQLLYDKTKRRPSVFPIIMEV